MSVNETRVQLQLLSRTGYPVWPTEYRDIDQRYSDAPSARLRVLTQPAFAAAKLSAWNDRATPRDLYDLWAMAAHGMIYGSRGLEPSQKGKALKFDDVIPDIPVSDREKGVSRFFVRPTARPSNTRVSCSWCSTALTCSSSLNMRRH
ncbi:MAG: nucleotidyl transferase AbiEii/AbiGii toxin family protein [Brevibacterium sp.]